MEAVPCFNAKPAIASFTRPDRRTHFCSAAGGPVARGEVLDLIRRLEVVDVALDGCGPVRLSRAVTSSLEELTGQRAAR